MEITGFLTAIFTGVAATITVYNQIKIKQKLYTRSYSITDYYFYFDVVLYNHSESSVCVSLDEENKYLKTWNKYLFKDNMFILEPNSRHVFNIKCPTYVDCRKYKMILISSRINGKKCLMITMVKNSNIVLNIVNKIEHMITYYTNYSKSK